MTSKPKTGADLKPAPVFLDTTEPPQWVALHKQACAEKKNSYLDPQTGFHVLTSYYLKSRGYCCTNKCRHCPYGFHKEAWPIDCEIDPKDIAKNETEE
ncbi:MAG: hypothetical protein H7256_00590 [Bdellovibrio sp.]|nr:hypothetical protein [Bdellovibrio sp.]